ncbi:MAG: TOBE domain-containing protein, partial [Alphaproteobacteria bacterium]|nr:TOBE domain-containing protein [Alphaproteobacteria bacterium]
EGLVGQVDGAPVVELGSFTLPLGAFAARAAAYHDRKVIVGIRPEALKLPEAKGGVGVISARTAFVEDLGATLLVQLDVDAANLVQASVAEEEDDLKAIRPRMRAMIDGVLAIAPGDVLTFTVDPAAIHLFDAETGMAL